MAEYITKDAVISLFEKWSDGYAYIEIPVQDAMRQVSAIPPADVWPVVRCRDCFANGSCIVQDALFDNDLDKAADFYCAFGRTGKDG